MSDDDSFEGRFADDFEGSDLDLSVWVPHYLPAWSSRAETRAAYEVRDSCLHLTIPTDHPLWCPDVHDGPLRVSGIQSGTHSGPVGSTRGQAPIVAGQQVREAQPTMWGWTPSGGLIEIRMRADISPRSMVAFWLIGLEDEPDRCAEICVAEIFGDAVEPGRSAEVGMGLHAFRDPAGREDFRAERLPIDVSDHHTYAADWTSERVDFLVDGQLVRSCAGPPTYPVQAMIAVFDFPDRTLGDDDHLVPELAVDWVRAS